MVLSAEVNAAAKIKALAKLGRKTEILDPENQGWAYEGEEGKAPTFILSYAVPKPNKAKVTELLNKAAKRAEVYKAEAELVAEVGVVPQSQILAEPLPTLVSHQAADVVKAEPAGEPDPLDLDAKGETTDKPPF